LVGVLAVLCATVGFAQARGGIHPGSVILFPYWDKTGDPGLNTVFRMTNINGVTPNFVTGPETLALHMWFMNRNCLEQNFFIPFTPHDTEWVVISTNGETWSERHDGAAQPLWDDAFLVTVNFPPVWDPFNEVFVDSNQGWAIGFAVSQSNDFGNLLVPWDFFIGDAIVQNIGLGWSFGYEALTTLAEANPAANHSLDGCLGAAGACPGALAACGGTTPCVLDADPLSGLYGWDLNQDGIGDAVEFLQAGIAVNPGSVLGAANETTRHYQPFGTANTFFPQYTRTMRFDNLPQDPLRPILGRAFETRYVILPWDGIFHAPTQWQNCYFFRGITYDYEEFPISNAQVFVRCWAICDLDFITQGAASANPSVFGWLDWTPDPLSPDSFGSRVCNPTVPSLGAGCVANIAQSILRPAGPNNNGIAPGYMGAYVLQYARRWEKWRDTSDGPVKRHWAWGFYSPQDFCVDGPAGGPADGVCDF
jgi:hypothetical protein